MEYQRALFEAEMKYKTAMFEAEIEYDCESSETESFSPETETVEMENDSSEVDQQTAKFQAMIDCKRALFAAEMKLKSRLASLNVETDRIRVVNRLQQIAKRFSALKEIATVVEPCLKIEQGQSVALKKVAAVVEPSLSIEKVQSVTPKEREGEWEEVSAIVQ
jgi:hypothetical protein